MSYSGGHVLKQEYSKKSHINENILFFYSNSIEDIYCLFQGIVFCEQQYMLSM